MKIAKYFLIFFISACSTNKQDPFAGAEKITQWQFVEGKYDQSIRLFLKDSLQTYNFRSVLTISKKYKDEHQLITLTFLSTLGNTLVRISDYNEQIEIDVPVPELNPHKDQVLQFYLEVKSLLIENQSTPNSGLYHFPMESNKIGLQTPKFWAIIKSTKI